MELLQLEVQLCLLCLMLPHERREGGAEDGDSGIRHASTPREKGEVVQERLLLLLLLLLR